MKNGEVVFQRIGTELPFGARSADWIENGQMIVVCGKTVQRRMLANMFFTADGKQFLKIEEGEFAEPGYKFSPGVYFKLNEGSHIMGLDWPCFKAGIHNLSRFINFCGRKHVREKDESCWEKRKKVLRAISEVYRWFVPGVYELKIEKRAWANESQPVVDPRPIRRADFASGEISAAESARLREFLEQWKQRAQRTAPINKVELISAINDLYSSFNLKTPGTVIVSSPLEMVVTGFLSMALAHTKKLGTTEVNPTLQTIDGMIARDIYEASVQTAFRSIEDLLDSQTAREFQRLIDEHRGAAALRSTYGASGVGVECAVREATAELMSWGHRKHSHVAEILRGTDKNIRALILSFLNDYWQYLEYGNTQRYDELLTSALREVLGVRFTVDEKLVAWQRVAANCAGMILHEEFCIVSDFPEAVHLGEEGRLHNAFGPSAQWRDGWTLHHWHGLRMPRRFIEEPETITIADIRTEQNIEVRRVILEFYGMKRFLMDSAAEEIHRDEFGVLYSVEIHPRMDPVVMVKVKNSTAEPDGTFKDYFLIVPPSMSTAKAAVAWTFDLTADEYGPIVQT